MNSRRRLMSATRLPPAARLTARSTCCRTAARAKTKARTEVGRSLHSGISVSAVRFGSTSALSLCRLNVRISAGRTGVPVLSLSAFGPEAGLGVGDLLPNNAASSRGGLLFARQAGEGFYDPARAFKSSLVANIAWKAESVPMRTFTQPPRDQRPTQKLRPNNWELD
jgi:hypothetical protein